MYDENLQEILGKKIEQESKRNCLRLDFMLGYTTEKRIANTIIYLGEKCI